jgi:hypothetical protein
MNTYEKSQGKRKSQGSNEEEEEEEEEEEFPMKSELKLRDNDQIHELFDPSSFTSLGKGGKSAKKISAEVKNTTRAKRKRKFGGI